MRKGAVDEEEVYRVIGGYLPDAVSHPKAPGKAERQLFVQKLE
ncbi:hypothetical protein ACFPUW_07740 [Thalassorhabdus alkalitolerans]|nr:hypothetical protein [Thalassobacillus sp. C254]